MSSVDDLDELLATRRLYGLNDGLFKEGNDTNVGSMIEEAFNELIDNFEVVAHLTPYGRKGIKDNVKKLQARIKELEESNRIYALNGCNIELELYIKENYIPVQKVKDLMEKEKLPLTIVGGRGNSKTLAYGIKLGKIKACEELLEENNNEKL